MIDVGIIGASGYTGVELLRLCHSHPELNVVFATGDSQAGNRIAQLYPSLAGGYPEEVFVPWSPELLDGVELVFLGLPHGTSQQIVPTLIDHDVSVVDLGADFRLRSSADYVQWYGAAHTCPELLDRFVYGLPELYREQLATTRLVATPGCYPTSASLPMAPLVRAGLVGTDRVIVDAASGVSGAGRPPKPTNTFCAVDEDVTAYGLLDHRHTPEMEMNIGATVIFTPHLVPMNRGILATCYAVPAVDGLSTADVLGCLDDFYRRRTIRGGGRTPTLHQGDARVERCSPDRQGRRSHRDRHRPRSDRQPRQGCLRCSGAVRQPGPRTRRDHRTLDDRDVPMSDQWPGEAHHDPSVAVDVLLQALPYIEQFRGAVVVVKFGGNAMSRPELLLGLREGHRACCTRVGMRPVVVHGGGPADRRAHGPPDRHGVRVPSTAAGSPTPTPSTWPSMVLIGKVNSRHRLRYQHARPRGRSACRATDAVLLDDRRSAAIPSSGSSGRSPRSTARVDRAAPSPMDLIPVIATIGADESGPGPTTSTPTTAATEIAPEHRSPRSSIFLTDVPGLLADVDDPGIAHHGGGHATRSVELIDDGVISGGHDPEDRQPASHAIGAGVGSAHLLDGRHLPRAAARAAHPRRSWDDGRQRACGEDVMSAAIGPDSRRRPWERRLT
ncbi:MAG: N-acetyl-gamma-glutamyl-phosphate reductase [Microthrixaceae bacterium]